MKLRVPELVMGAGLGMLAHDVFIHATEGPPGQVVDPFPTDRIHGWMVGAGLAFLGLGLMNVEEDEDA